MGFDLWINCPSESNHHELLKTVCQLKLLSLLCPCILCLLHVSFGRRKEFQKDFFRRNNTMDIIHSEEKVSFLTFYSICTGQLCPSHHLHYLVNSIYPKNCTIFWPLFLGDAFSVSHNEPICQVIYSQFGLAIHQNDHQARRRFVEWAQNEIAIVLDFHKRILFSDEAHFWLNGYVNKQNCRIWSEANPQVYVETPLHPEKLTVRCALWAGGILQKR
ncbi:hypothetical protein TNCV_3681351 [Trichonephila clavipes]|uniref:Uncharacterized protein n=1 Tax=Trichonephila clavipes TaxID=2585209 RepID=A0A8X6RFE1_TRICX|nr:hypothetical protein TNCV_3681351 [Trichonephila clavipes]